MERNVRRVAAIPDGKRRKPSHVIQRCDLNIAVSCGAEIRNLKKVLQLRLQDEETVMRLNKLSKQMKILN